MKKLAILIGVSLLVSGTAMASEYETSKMEGGMKFAEQQTDKKFNSKSSPVEIGELSEVQEAECNAEAKDYSKMTKKAPPSLKGEADVDKEESKTGEMTGAVAGGVVGGLAGVTYAGALAFGAAFVGTVTTAAIVTPIVVGVAAGAAVGYGIVHGFKKLLD